MRRLPPHQRGVLTLSRWLDLGLLAVLLGVPACTHYRPAPLDPEAHATTLEMRSLSDPGLKEFAASAPGTHETEWPPTTWGLDELTLAAFYFHPSLEVARAAWRAACASEITAGARPNPIVSLGPQYALNPATGVTPWLAFADLDIPVETAGKRGYRVAQAQQISEAARLDIVRTAWTVRSRLRDAFLRFAQARQQMALRQRLVALQEQVLGRLEQKSTAGAVSNADLIPHRLSLHKTRLEEGEAEGSGAEARAAVAAAIGIPTSSLEQVRLAETLPELSGSAAGLTSAESRRLALTRRADVLTALAEYAAAEAALQLAVAQQYPDLRLGPGYEYDQGENKFGLRLGLEVPVLSQKQGPIAEAVAKRAQAAARFTAVQAAVLAEVDAALTALQATKHQCEQQEELTRVQRQHVETMRHQLNTGAVEVLDVLSSDVELVTVELARQELLFQHQQALGRLEEAIQRPLSVDVTCDAASISPPSPAEP